MWRCGNHANHLVELCARTVVGADLIKLLFSFAAFMRSGSNFVRVMLALHTVLDKLLVYKEDDEAPEDGMAYALIVKNHMVQHFNAFENAYASEGDARDRSRKSKWRHAGLFDRLLKVFNGRWWIGACVYHHGAWPDGRRGCLREMVAVTAKVALRALTISPEAGKWTKLGPCVDSIVLLKVIHNLFLHLVRNRVRGWSLTSPHPRRAVSIWTRLRWRDSTGNGRRAFGLRTPRRWPSRRSGRSRLWCSC